MDPQFDYLNPFFGWWIAAAVVECLLRFLYSHWKSYYDYANEDDGFHWKQ